jgi:hypothetical protein
MVEGLKMSEETLEDIRYSVETIVGYFTDDYHDRKVIVDELLNDVVKDISETTDTYFNDSDVRLAFVRVIKARLGIEQ